MTHTVLRKKYPKFIYDKFEYETVGSNLEIKFYYSIPPDHKFTHKIKISPIPSLRLREGNQRGELDSLIFHVGLSLIPSYWKSTCSPVIDLSTINYQLSTEQLAFWHKLFIKGMGEYFYKNQIDFTPKNFITFNQAHAGVMRTGAQREAGTDQAGEHLQSHTPNAQSVLVPIGGGKDSIVTLELLKSHYKTIPLVINPVPVMFEVIKTSGIKEFIEINSQIDPYLLELNKQGYLNGHIPLSAFYAFTSVLAAYLTNSRFIAFSNERSSNEGNTTYLGHEINHQYSKSLEFETDFNSYLKTLNSQLSTFNYFSFLRPLYELQITKLFCKYPQYFNVFSSCNQNFKLSTINSQLSTKWCSHCPKCVSTALMLANFIGKDKVIEIMGSYPPDQQFNHETMQQLLGNSPVKPFECVLTRAEAQAAFTGNGLDKLLSSWMDNPNMPKEFEKILKSAV